MIQFDEHIFQMGWFNHQLVMIETKIASSSLWIDVCVYVDTQKDYMYIYICMYISTSMYNQGPILPKSNMAKS